MENDKTYFFLFMASLTTKLSLNVDKIHQS